MSNLENLTGWLGRSPAEEALARRDVDDRARYGDDRVDDPTDPWREPTSADLLDDVAGFIARFCVFPSEHALIAVTLWAAHAHLVDRFDSTPRLALLSPEKQCGKTRVLEVLDLLCPGTERLSDASPAYMFRRISADDDVTVMLDEVDAIWRRGKADESAEALRSIVNSGHRKGGYVGRVEMQGQKAVLTRFPVFAPVALAGIGNCLPDTVLDRAVIIRMRRRAPGEFVEEYRERTARPDGESLRERLAAWALSVADRVGSPWPTMPKGVADRPADVWEALLSVAELAGGDWPKRARAACVAFVSGSRDDTDSVGVRLLQDLHDVFGVADAMWTETILSKLHGISEGPWADWYGKPLNDRQLAKLLHPYEVGSTKVRIGEKSLRGYTRADLWDAWARYGVLSRGSGTSGTSGTPLAGAVPLVPDVPDTHARACALCQRPFEPEHPSRIVCPQCRPHLADTTTTTDKSKRREG